MLLLCFRQVSIFSVEKGIDLQSASARRVSLTWMLQFVIQHGLYISELFGEWVWPFEEAVAGLDISVAEYRS